ncbi:unannotated protein [freshwater metagenome]|uniref:Unannotated protein n=1 Tax=freshwater metagenome TaxID=449393 RepID=A0A6J6N876_9ZZZZ
MKSRAGNDTMVPVTGGSFAGNTAAAVTSDVGRTKPAPNSDAVNAIEAIRRRNEMGDWLGAVVDRSKRILALSFIWGFPIFRQTSCESCTWYPTG